MPAYLAAYASLLVGLVLVVATGFPRGFAATLLVRALLIGAILILALRLSHLPST